ncbi:DUF5337 family protein [Vannielia sp.]|uniref:DUF5337 family protein n=1 Tax=Vannielia sp. TaxID=2813045 RepID=UPI00260505F8|nr:DUF5337 family protein [Vannielia sp.]MDF1871356.1 DUF5337 family protein [Vannielia sp.]
MSSPEQDRDFARAGRKLALMVAGAGVLAIIAPWLVQKLGVEPRYEILIYLIAMAVFAYAMVQLVMLWRRR